MRPSQYFANIYIRFDFCILDSNIYAWNRQHTTLLEVLSGHRGIVNSVNWNPVDPHMFASAGDDHTIRM